VDFSAVNNARVDEPYGRIDTREKKDTVQENFWKGGRNTLYSQRAVAAYTLPLGKLPLTDWVTARYSYTTTYNWIGASRLAIDLGNTIENSQEHSINGEFDFTRLYQKSRWLRALDNPVQPKQKGTDVKNPGKVTPDVDNETKLPSRSDATKGLSGKAKKDALDRWRAQRRAAKIAKANRPVEMSPFMRGTGKFFTMVRRVSANYSENFRSRLPGYMDSTRFLGQNWNSMAPGLDYVFGKQPDTAWLSQQAAKGLITRSSEFNFLFRQQYDQRLTFTAQLEPLREFMVDLNLEKSFNKDYSELFKNKSQSVTLDTFRHLSPLSAGGFNVSYIAFNTLFKKFKPNEVSETFKNFENYRLDVSKRVAEQNQYWVNSGRQVEADGFAKGYNRYSQDVLIPAFIAAYTGKSPYDVALLKQSNPNVKSNPFRSILPRPNWKLTYTGLSRIPALAKSFSTISITHGYTGNLSMNSYTSALLFQDPFYYAAPGFVDPVSGNYVPYFLVPNITIQEQFQPLIGVDITTTSQLTVRAEYKKSRQLSLSLIDYQLSELNSTEWTFGFSWRRRGLNLPNFLEKLINKGKPLENDINFRLDLAMRDDAQSNSRLDQANAYSTGGQKVVTIQPSIDYVLNNRINLKLFFDQRRVTPYVSTSAPMVNTRAGLQLRIALAQ
jgi:cell surface protein SprA